ncbi:nuclear transport factor 2 family protein [Actinokineospora auranticolor]|uniref:SnoaL-like protein n=1 Tax=Actinokineospora auranticolor TaxID=155976 RepID=A0A2S6GYA0_9PSEU|nr:nuclear transport factor 2 family protein [Actinokineospora auranticolor]PPK70203.1 SnoaL-like protein [Actinokineospora auranticolor]
MRIVGIILVACAALALAACADSGSGGSGSGGSGAGSGGGGAAAAQPVDVKPEGKSYVDAVQSEDLDKLANSFTEDAVVVDVGRRIEGRQKIREWADNEVIGGEIEVLGRTPFDGGETLLVRFNPSGLGGGFEANYKFTYKDGRIAQADLTYA